ncbi:LAQU0S11e00342g1_1 [Lachancea quebecensis]|uniref:LAQU0S11e00342g1_1 n=1 Tax=Lachancea quebecensis TaxID=1654605 RepID=A0A0P1KUL3_9SACH|nr:LAQU0S11e00342g1_1 [Lachancea quebecensis]
MEDTLERNAEQLPVPLESRPSQIHIHHHHHYHRRTASSEGGPQGKREAGSSKKNTYRSIKSLTLNNLDARQHFLIAVCRDVSLLPPLLSLAHSLKKAWSLWYRKDMLYAMDNNSGSLTVSFTKLWQTYRALRTQASSGGTDLSSQLITARSSEYILCSLWCVVSAYLTYAILDSLMVRWIVKYSTIAAILRMFSMSLLIITLEMLLLSSLSPKGDYYLHTWILISCVLTGAYIWQSFLTSDLSYVEKNSTSAGSTSAYGRRSSSSHSLSTLSDPTNASEEDLSTQTASRKRRSPRSVFNFAKNKQIHFYNITVFCVVPVGFASFITMIGLLRNLVIQRLDVEQLERIIREVYND